MPVEGRGRQISLSSARRMAGTQRPIPMTQSLRRLTALAVCWSEEPGAGNPHAGFCEGVPYDPVLYPTAFTDLFVTGRSRPGPRRPLSSTSGVPEIPQSPSGAPASRQRGPRRPRLSFRAREAPARPPRDVASAGGLCYMMARCRCGGAERGRQEAPRAVGMQAAPCSGWPIA